MLLTHFLDDARDPFDIVCPKLPPSAIDAQKWFKTSGAVIGLLLIASTLEHFGGPSAPVFATLNVIANVFWAVWMVIFAIQLLDLGRVGNRLPVQPAH